MGDKTDADLTLPSVVSALSGRSRQQGLFLTVVFHPQTSRIGETAEVTPRSGNTPWVLGRRSPLFAGLTRQIPAALDDPHVSRRALELDFNGRCLLVRRLTSGRCRVAGTELDSEQRFDREQLQVGVPIFLGHTVVLLLRFAAYRAEATAAPCADDLLLGESPYMCSLRGEIARAAGSDLDVLVRGETGTGKELVAKAVHAGSRRSGQSLVSVNMAAIAPELASAALFGSARGAFTGADKNRTGYFQQAQGGTLFLDEIGDTPSAVQPQLLRALEQREIQSVGGAIRRVDLRVISATDADLEEDRDFKSALRHRLGASVIHVLPLREHPEDIGVLSRHFFSAAAAEAGRESLLPDAQSSSIEIATWAELFHRFVCYSWPGNVRELLNFSRQVVLASEGGVNLPGNVEAALMRAQSLQVADAPGANPGRAVRRKIQDVSAQELDAALLANRYEITHTARQLGVSRQSVYRLIDESSSHRLAGEVPQQELDDALRAEGGDIVAAALTLRVSVISLRARVRRVVAGQAD